jgi:hypothetical protein
MPEDVNTDEDLYPPPLVERDQWESAFEPFEGRPDAALSLGFNFALLLKYFDGQLIKSRPIMEALDMALEVLFPFTDFHQASCDLFIKLMEGKLTFEEEEILKAQGIKF